jgi:phosphonate transport system substrate-binding protein
MSRVAAAAGVFAAVALSVPSPAGAAECPNGGTVRFGVEPYEAAAKLTPIYQHIGDLLGAKLGCKVEVLITTSYTAEIEAMRSGKLEIGEFGPFGYVLAHQVAGAQAVAGFADKDGKPATYTAGIVTWPGSGVTALKEVAGHTFAYSDPASTSGHLFPAMALKQAGIDPDNGVKPLYAGSHGASFEAIRNHKVEAGELNSQEIAAAQLAGSYKPEDYVELWRSGPIPLDPITVSDKLPADFKAHATEVLQTLDLSELSAADLKIIGQSSPHLVPQSDAAYDPIRELVGVLNIDLNKME